MVDFLACGCNLDGAYTYSCDTTGKCDCKPGYTGDKCSGECEDEYYASGSHCWGKFYFNR